MPSSKRALDLLKPFLISEVSEGEWDMRCPIPSHGGKGRGDKTRSARVNFDKKVWKCFGGCGGGRLSDLLSRMGEGGRSKKKTRPSSPGRKITQTEVDRWHVELMSDDYAKEFLWMQRGISEETMVTYQLGYDRASKAFTIPIYSGGELYNARKYRPGAPSDKKIWWAVKKDPNTIIPIYPEAILDGSDWVVLCEGEMDALIAIQFGFPAVTGLAGAGTWNVTWSERFKGKRVFIVYDRDPVGSKSARDVAEHLEAFAEAIWTVKIPIKKQGADVTDYLVQHAHTQEDFRELLRHGKRFQKRIKDPIEMTPVQVSVMDSFNSQNVGRAQSMDVLILGRTKDTYALPKVVTSTCTMDAGPRCKFCPMLAKDGKMNYDISPSSPSLLEMMGSPTKTQDEALRKHIRAVKCDKLEHQIKSFQTIEQLYVRPSWDETSGDFTPRRVNSVGKHDTMPSQVVHVIGTTWPDPKEQKNEFLAWEVDEAENAIDEFRVTPEIVRTLRQFKTRGDQKPLIKMGMIARDFERRVTHIYGRLDLHIAMDLVFHSVIAFPFQGKLERRGWLDALVVGDTRTGKSEVAQRMLEHYRTGQFVNCEAATFAGVVGGLQQMADRQWAVTWGIVPMSDRRLVVLDEASGLSQEEIQKMSDVRSRGIIKMAKIQSDQAWARTRLFWLSNPRNESMEKYTYGIQAIPPLIGNREDIARFDFAMALTNADVEMAEIYTIPSQRLARYSSEDCHTRVLWAWSRTPEDIEWEKGAERDVLKAAEWLGEQYISDPPLLQVANAHVKVARISVAMATALFSSDSSGRRVVVKRGHVIGATRFLHHLYSKDTFGYHKMSERSRDQKNRAIKNADKAKEYLLENRMLIEFLQGVEGQFRRDMVEPMVNVSREEANAIVNRLFVWGLVSSDGYGVKMNPALHALLREIEEG